MFLWCMVLMLAGVFWPTLSPKLAVIFSITPFILGRPVHVLATTTTIIIVSNLMQGDNIKCLQYNHNNLHNNKHLCDFAGPNEESIQNMVAYKPHHKFPLNGSFIVVTFWLFSRYFNGFHLTSHKELINDANAEIMSHFL